MGININTAERTLVRHSTLTREINPLYFASKHRVARKSCGGRAAECDPKQEAGQPRRERLYAAVLDRSEDQLNLPDGLPTGLVADLLSQRLTVPQPLMEQIFSELEVTRRAKLALAAHSRYPPDET